MHFEQLDSLSLPGDPAKPNEDAFSDGAYFAAMFDGATGLGENLLPGGSDAQWLARFASRRLAAHAAEDLAPGEALRAAAGDAAHSFQGLRRRAPKARYETPYASLMFVTLRDGALDALWFGDCAAILRAPDGTVTVIGDTLTKRTAERDRVKAMSATSKKGPAAAGVRAEFLPQLRKTRNAINTAKGAWLFAPDAACADHAASARIATTPGSLLLLATDGFLTLVSDYARYDAAGFMEAAEKGLAKMGEDIRAIEAEDPEGRAYPRFKKSDDATAILLRVAD